MCSDRLENKRPVLLHDGEKDGTGNGRKRDFFMLSLP